MKRSLLILSLFLNLLFPALARGNDPYFNFIKLNGKSWYCRLNASSGTLESFNQNGAVVPFRTDSLAGPTWEGVSLNQSASDSLLFEGIKDGILYTTRYIPFPNHLAIECAISNTTSKPFAPERCGFSMGIDSEMRTYPEWNDKYFPTLLRCEKDYAWGYFMSPEGKIIAVAIDSPVASYSIHYIYRGIKEWKWGHQIFTAAWDMLHCGPLPFRHPQSLQTLHPKETKRWTIHIGCVTDVADVKPVIAQWSSAPILELDKYTVAEKENATLSINSSSKIKSIVCIYNNGKQLTLKPTYLSQNIYQASIPTPDAGKYKIIVMNASGYQSEAILHVRRDWKEYLYQVRDRVAQYPPLMGNSCEMFYGYYPAFLGARHFPSPLDSNLQNRFLRQIPLIVDPATGLPTDKANPNRVQNFSSLIGIATDLYEATNDINILRIASRIGDYLASERIQHADGSYRSGNTHYTAVIYPAKSMLELADAELNGFKQSGDSVWLVNSLRHRTSALRAIEDLSQRLDNIQTEGDMTFEDGMISCSALQLALGALKADNEEMRTRYTEAAAYMIDRHRCLEQNQIPDARMRGATLRYWEALDVYFSPNQVMNSPHGWTAWKIYAVYYLYLLTGDMKYFNDLNDTLGACVQLMEADGTLHWGFIPDPYVNGRICVPAKSEVKGSFEYTDSIVGEQYLEMISPWMRPDDEFALHNFKQIGGSGDGTVYEIFKALEETMIATSYLRVENDNHNSFQINCTTSRNDDVLEIQTYNCCNRLSIFIDRPSKLRINHADIINLPKGISFIPLHNN